MNPQVDIIQPTYPGDTVFAVALTVLPPVEPESSEAQQFSSRFGWAVFDPEFRGVPDSPLHD